MFDRSTMSSKAALAVAFVTVAATLPSVAGAQQRSAFRATGLPRPNTAGCIRLSLKALTRSMASMSPSRWAARKSTACNCSRPDRWTSSWASTSELQGPEPGHPGGQRRLFPEGPDRRHCPQRRKDLCRPEIEKRCLVSTDGQTNWWPWAKAKYSFKDDRHGPTPSTCSPSSPTEYGAAGLLTSRRWPCRRPASRMPRCSARGSRLPALHRDHYVAQKTIDANPKMVESFVKATMEGWKLLRNPAPGNALIKKDNPAMTDELLAYGSRNEGDGYRRWRRRRQTGHRHHHASTHETDLGHDGCQQAGRYHESQVQRCVDGKFVKDVKVMPWRITACPPLKFRPPEDHPTACAHCCRSI